LYVLHAQSALTSVDTEAMEKLQRRCVELEHQLVTERSHKDDQLNDTQQQQIDDIIVKYKERIKTIEDDKMAVRIYTVSQKMLTKSQSKP